MSLQLLQLSLRSVSLTQLGSVRNRAGRPLICRSSQHHHCRARSQLVVQANELNKWANRDGRDEPFGLDEDGHIRDTAAVVLRVLTARSVQVLLMQLQETDVFVAQYLNNFAAENPPSQDKFLNKLFAQPGKSVKDPGTGAIHKIDPQAIAHRVLQTREEMARSVMVGFDAFVSQQNTVVLRDYLTNSTFTSGTTEKGYKERRGYYRRRDVKPQADDSEAES